jgi:hypothetical protein
MSYINVQTFSGKVNITSNLLVGSSHLFVDTTNNRVGITTASPSASLDVNGDVNVGTNITFGGILTGNGSGLTSVNSDSGLWAGAGTGSVYLSTSTDNVGIGKTPSEKLDVEGIIRVNRNGGSLQLVGTDHTYIEYYPDGVSSGRKAYVGYAGGSDNNFTISNSAGNGHVILGGGSVGIGVSDPDSKLEVRGNIRASFSDTNHGMFIDAGGTILRNYGGNGAGLHFTANQIFPTNYLGAYSAGGIDLGSSSYRWNNVYTEDLNASGTIDSTGIITCNANKMVITGSSPTLYFRDSDQRTGMIHQNANRMYFLTGVANSDSWTQTANSRWPLYLQMDTNEAVFGGNIDAAVGTVTASTFSATSQVYLGTSASIRQTSTPGWTGDPGSGVGKIEYHSNRWYIVAGSNSSELLRVRQNNSDKFAIDNSGSISLGIVPAARISGTVASATNADTVDGQHAHEMSWGHDIGHGTYTDFNSFINTDKFGAHYVTGTTNGPGQSGPTQYYHQRLSLGSDYNNYSLQLAIGRGSSDNYLWYRNEEAGSASSWYKMRAGYADSAGTLNTQAYINRVRPYSNSYGAGYDQSSLEIREYNLEGSAGGTEWARAPRIGLHWSGRVASQIICESNGRISVVNNPGNAYEAFGAGSIYTSGSIEADGRIYADNGCHVRGDWLRVNGQAGIYFESYGGGWWMIDSTYIRNYNSKMLQIEGSGARIYGTEATVNYGSTTYGYRATGLIADPANYDFSMYVDKSVRAAGYVAFSDRRIKSNVVDINDTYALEQVRKLKPKYYDYVDKSSRGDSSVIGFIAQEVKEVVPRAVSVSDGDVPNIYETGNIGPGNTITFTKFDTSTLESSTKTLIVYLSKQDRKEVTVTEVIDKHTLRVEEDISEWGRSMDEDGKLIYEEKIVTVTPDEYKNLVDKMGYKPVVTGYSNGVETISVEEYHALEVNTGYSEFIGHYEINKKIYEGSEIFVWGQKVNDFHHLNKDYLWTIGTAALQEVDRQLQAEKAKTYELQKKVELLEMSHTSLIQRIEALENL